MNRQQWHFGMKAPIGVESATALVHRASVTAANVHDGQELGNLLHGQQTRLKRIWGFAKVCPQCAPRPWKLASKSLKW